MTKTTMKNQNTIPFYKKMTWAGLGLCGLCCALPILGIALGVGSLTAMAMYLEKVGIVALGLAGGFFLYGQYKKRKLANSCEASCDTDCGCKTETHAESK